MIVLQSSSAVVSSLCQATPAYLQLQELRGAGGRGFQERGNIKIIIVAIYFTFYRKTGDFVLKTVKFPAAMLQCTNAEVYKNNIRRRNGSAKTEREK